MSKRRRNLLLGRRPRETGNDALREWVIDGEFDEVPELDDDRDEVDEALAQFWREDR